MRLYFLNRTWVAFESSTSLVTCDEPVVLVPAPTDSRADSIGIGNAGVILFPAGPNTLLALFRNDLVEGGFEPGAHRIQHGSIDSGEAEEVNQEVAMASHTWIFETPSTRIGETYDLPRAEDSHSLTRYRASQENEMQMLFHFAAPTGRWTNPNWVNKPRPLRRYWG